MKRNPFISLPGCITALIFVAAMVGITFASGGVLFSPGALSAQGAGKPPLKNFTSHADFEGRCEWCHAPWEGVTAALCEDCHANVAEERRAAGGVHGVLKNAVDCRGCHVEHQGRAAEQSALAMTAFPHDETGYSLVTHRAWPDGRSFTCRDCHDAQAPGYAFAQPVCETCHRQVDAAFVEQHIAQFSADCFACHGQLEPFNHQSFTLRGGHAGVACRDCHVQSDWAQISTACVTCHADPAIHAGLFGQDCAVCHVIDGWIPARLGQHDFPLDHGGEGETACVTCHVNTYAAYICTNCHEHSDVDEIRTEHVEEGIVQFSDCMECHADGLVHE